MAGRSETDDTQHEVLVWQLAICAYDQTFSTRPKLTRTNVPNLVSFLGRFIPDISFAICFSISSSSSTSSSSSLTVTAFCEVSSVPPVGQSSSESYHHALVMDRKGEHTARLTCPKRSCSSPTACFSFPLIQVTHTPGPSILCLIGVPSYDLDSKNSTTFGAVYKILGDVHSGIASGACPLHPACAWYQTFRVLGGVAMAKCESRSISGIVQSRTSIPRSKTVRVTQVD